MSWNGAGVFNRIYSWVADKNAGIDITASRIDTDTDDITSNGFGNTLTRDGQGSATANLPMNNFRHTGVSNGVARTDYAALGQLEDGLINWGIATGTSDAISASYAPAITTLADGQLCFFRAIAANLTTTPTFSPNGLTPEVITKIGGNALATGDIPGALAEMGVRYNLAHTRWELLNPAGLSLASAINELEVTLDSASTTNIGAALGNYIIVTGTTSITAFDTIAAGAERTLEFQGSLTLTYNGTSLILPGAANIQTVAGDVAKFRSEGSGNWRCVSYLRSTPVPVPAITVPFSGFAEPLNLSITASVGSSILTVAIKDNAGNDPTSISPVWIPFRSPTASNGAPVWRQITSALSINTNAIGASLGSSNNTAFRFWLVAFDNSGTVVLALINCSTATQIFPLNEAATQSSTQMTSGATSAGTFYTPNGLSVSNKSFRIIGYLEWSSGLSTAGTYASGPTGIQLFGPSIKKPGDVVQSVVTQTGAVSTGTTALSVSDSVPQNTSGDQYMSLAITPTATCNILEIESQAAIFSSSGSAMGLALFQDSVANALTAIEMGTLSVLMGTMLFWRMLAGTSSSTTFKIRAGANSGSTTTFNGVSGSRIFGGVMNSYMRITEFMG